ncbi:hypothetical protein [Calidifontibacillus oryziterrae]|uniref:hypothetical protein n=1 Tax=Calidifontibacillus oryziterrae TaxID=1191699 RepID=UPI000311A98B|nr:hypothetical protein [Calidifontibacillus oryziterrae]
MIIKKKKDAKEFLQNFLTVANFDDVNKKYYFVFEDKIRGGQYTLMKKDEQWSTHGKGEDYCEIGETIYTDIDELVNFLWLHRARINQVLKENVDEMVMI